MIEALAKVESYMVFGDTYFRVAEEVKRLAQALPGILNILSADIF